MDSGSSGRAYQAWRRRRHAAAPERLQRRRRQHQRHAAPQQRWGQRRGQPWRRQMRRTGVAIAVGRGRRAYTRSIRAAIAHVVQGVSTRPMSRPMLRPDEAGPHRGYESKPMLNMDFRLMLRPMLKPMLKPDEAGPHRGYDTKTSTNHQFSLNAEARSKAHVEAR